MSSGEGRSGRCDDRRTLPVRAVFLFLFAATAAFAAGCGGGGSGGSEHSTAPYGFRSERVASGLGAVTGFAFLPDGRVLVAEQQGLVQLIDHGKVAKRPFIDLRKQVNAYRERGLLGIAVDPDFGTNHFVYLLYSYENDAAAPQATKTERLVRVVAGRDTASRSQVVLVGTDVGSTCKNFPRDADCIPNDWKGHAGGGIVVAPDGTLFASLGDGSNWNKATADSLRTQDVDSLAGKIVHVTRDGLGLASNPFWNGHPRAARSKVWAYGFRNPFRMDRSPWSGNLYVGDVGWARNEEVDVVNRGGNYGWPCYEGPAPQRRYGHFATCRAFWSRAHPGVRQPLITWRQGKVRAAVIGGSFNTGTAFPPIYDGAYFYGDYVRSTISYVQVDRRDRIISGPWQFASDVPGLVQLRFGPDGFLYYLSIATGELRRFVPETPVATRRLLARPLVLPTGLNTHSVGSADLNGDGVPDLYAAAAGANRVAVMLGRRGGGYAPAVSYATGKRPKKAIAVDLNGDGVLDLVTANQDSSTVSVLLGRGDGTFRPARDYPVCSRAHDVAAADLDGDGHPDLAVACFQGTVVAVLHGNGDGTFRKAVMHESGKGPHAILVVDVTGDGRPDLVVANRQEDTVAVLRGDGHGGFAAPVDYPVGHHPHSLAAADLNGDGRPDVVSADDGSDEVSVLLGAPGGRFAKAVSYATGRVPKGVAVGDVDGDGRLDIVTANTGGNYDGPTRSPLGDTISVLRGQGDGTFAAPVTYVAGGTPFAVVVADLNGDGREDLATANWDGGSVSVLYQRPAANRRRLIRAAETPRRRHP
jgi:glucose/arabinose dehydrogenase